MFENLNFELDIDCIADVKEQRTSEAYKKNVKIFLETLDIRIDPIKNPTYQIINNVLADLELPTRGQQLRIRTQQQINLISLILKIVDSHSTIDELTIATYTLNKEAFSILFDLLKGGRIKKLSLFLASSYSFRNKEYYEYLKNTALQLKETYDFHLAFAWLHFKITLAKCGDDYYQFEGSMNYSTNNMAEQILFENRETTYNYDYNILHNIIKDRKTKALEIIC